MSDSIVRECLGFLNFVGVHPHVVNTYASLRCIYHFFHLTVTWILLILEMIVNWNGVDTLDNGAELVFGSFQIMMKTFTMYKMRKEVIELFKQIDYFWPIDKDNEEVGKELNSIYGNIGIAYKIFRNSVIASAIVIAVKPFFLRGRELPVKTYDICDLQNNACYASCFLWQIVHLAEMVISVMGFDGLFFMLLTRVYCQFKMIKYGLLALGDDNRTEEILMKQVSEFVDHHNFLLGFMNGMNIVYANFLFVQFSTSLAEVCVVTFLFSINGFAPGIYRTVRYGPMLMMLLAQIYLYCVAGDKIAEESESIADVAYECQWWTKYHPKMRKSICLIIQRAQLPTQLSAGGLFDLDMRTFSGILQKAWSLYMAIQQIHRDEAVEK